MDILAHFLWTYVIYFRYKTHRLLAAFFGIFPDLGSFGFFFLLSLFSGTLEFGKPELSSIPNYVFFSYNLTHSLIAAFFVILVIYLLTKRIPWILGGWILHILIDIPTHTDSFFPTPFLWPLSNFTFNGISWADKEFLIINYSLLILVYAYLFIKFKDKKV